MKLKDGFVLNKVGGSYLAVAVGDRADEFSALIKLNGTGAFLWELLAKRDCTDKELTEMLVSEYDAPEELAKADVTRFLEQLRSGGLLDE